MSVLSLILLILIVGAALWLVLEPLRSGQPSDPDAPKREQLRAEQARLYAELAALPADPDSDRRRPDLERRAALTLRALDALPPSRAPRRAPAPWPWERWPPPSP
ncbi:hypothetical protein [Deinococcus aquaticus]|uniref:hypothetical protein n=1 Tax=Deinococcus aquaticus TaxID=328692 RepID=UPI0036071388